MPRTPHLPSGWLAVCLALTCLAPTSAFAWTFVYTGIGGDQHINWHWDSGYPVHGCQSNPTPCGDFATVSGAHFSSFSSGFGMPFGGSVTTTSGDSLGWGGTDSLKVVARTVATTRTFDGYSVINPGYAESWVAINARDVPMVFQMIPSAGDPAGANLKISAQLGGSITHLSTVGGYTHMFIQMEMVVRVNGVRAVSDSLYGDWEYQEGAGDTRTLSFPKGFSNLAMVSNVPANSQISVSIWAYARANSSITGAIQSEGTITSTGPYFRGPAITVLVQPLGVTAVDEAPSPGSLSLAARPNPSSGAARLEYTLPRSGSVRLAIYDVTGHRVATLVEGVQEAGRREAVWNGKHADGQDARAGVYLMELVAGGERRVGKLVVTR